MMKPMLLNKFGISPDKISAGFLHGRIKGLSSAKTRVQSGELLAYLHGSTQELTDRLEAEVRKHVQIRLSSPVTRIDKVNDGFSVSSSGSEFKARCVVNTLPLQVFEKISKNFLFHNRIDYQGVICTIFSIVEKLTPLYWINIIDEDITFRVLVNQTLLDDYNNTIVYCANYVPENHSLFQMSNREIVELYKKDLETIFGKITVVDYSVFRTPYATPVFDRNFAEKIMELENLAAGMYFAGAVKIYPGSRTLSSVIRTGYEAADKVLELLQQHY
jgi:protoporphyrinogen oxidase